MNNATIQKSNRAAFSVLSVVIWQFFSNFGIQALLILYLTQALHFSDNYAYSLFGGYFTLIYLTPIVGGWIADRWFGFKMAIIIGCILIIIGHFILLFFSEWNGLIWGLTYIVLGVGFLKTNAICLVADCYHDFPDKHDSVYVLYYVLANVGATLGPIVCAVVANQFGWRYGFAMAGLGMVFGLSVFLSHRSYWKDMGPPKKILLKKSILILIVGIIAASFLIKILLVKMLAGWLLVITAIAILPFVVTLYKRLDRKVHGQFIMLFILTLFGTIFWAFDQQGCSSISLFILRDVNRVVGSFTIPTAWFQSINPAIITLVGPLVALLWKWLANKKINIKAVFKMMFGIGMLTCGFVTIILGEKLANNPGHISHIIWPVLGISFIGIAELFVDPVILSQINKTAPKQSRGFMTGLYYLFVGAYANYISIQIAKLSVFSSHAVQATVNGYINEFSFITIAGATLFAVLLMIGIFVSLKEKKRFLSISPSRNEKFELDPA